MYTDACRGLVGRSCRSWGPASEVLSQRKGAEAVGSGSSNGSAEYYNEASSRALVVGSFEEKSISQREKSRRVTISAAVACVWLRAASVVESKERRGVKP